MGYNTTVLIINDGLSQIELHPDEFVEGINRSLMMGGEISVGNHANPAQVMPTAHADIFRLYATHGNLILELSRSSEKTLELARRDDQRRRLVESYIERAQQALNALKRELAS